MAHWADIMVSLLALHLQFILLPVYCNHAPVQIPKFICWIKKFLPYAGALRNVMSKLKSLPTEGYWRFISADRSSIHHSLWVAFSLENAE